jgi:hypothetical protein
MLTKMKKRIVATRLAVKKGVEGKNENENGV